jgi:hypothetical protein
LDWLAGFKIDIPVPTRVRRFLFPSVVNTHQKCFADSLSCFFANMPLAIRRVYAIYIRWVASRIAVFGTDTPDIGLLTGSVVAFEFLQIKK